MSTEMNKRIARRWVEELWGAGCLYVADAIVAPDYARHDPWDPVPVVGAAGVKRLVTMVRTAFPGFRVTLEAQVAEDDSVAVRFLIRATLEGKGLCVTAIEILRIADGKIVESWANRDDLGMRRQLEAPPAADR